MRSRAMIAVIALALVAGCGGSDDPEEDGATQAQTTTGQNAEPDGGPAPSAEPLGPPKAKESIDEAQARIAKAVASDDCDKVNELNPINREALDTAARCEYLQRLDGLKVLGAEKFESAGVIDYEFADRVLSALLVVDSDGLYHVLLFDAYNPKQSVGTEFAEQEFDQAVNRAVEALADGDCKAYLEVAHRRFGRGSRPDNEVCETIEPNPVQLIRDADPKAKPKPLGGNAAYAFYSLGSSRANFTLVLGRQTDEAIPEGVDPLPEGHAEYAYIDAYLTTRRTEE
jgi:hypothetical protein